MLKLLSTTTFASRHTLTGFLSHTSTTAAARVLLARQYATT